MGDDLVFQRSQSGVAPGKGRCWSFNTLLVSNRFEINAAKNHRFPPDYLSRTRYETGVLRSRLNWINRNGPFFIKQVPTAIAATRTKNGHQRNRGVLLQRIIYEDGKHLWQQGDLPGC